MPDAAAVWLAAMLATLAAAVLLAARAGLDARPAFWAGVCGIAGALALGRLWLAAFGGQPVDGPLLEDLLEGEKSVMGAALGAGAGAWLWLRARSQPALKYFDAAMPAAFIGYAIGRVGCLIAGCCFGTPTELPWGVAYPEPHSHPAAVYHVLLALPLGYLAFKAYGTPGRPLAVGLLGYGVGRFLLEFLRGDAIPTELGLSVAQLGSIGFAVAGLCLWEFGRSNRMSACFRAKPSAV